MALKLTAVFLLSGISFVALQGCGGGDDAEDVNEAAATTAAPASPTAAATPAPTASPTAGPTPAPTPDPCNKDFMCDCDFAICEDATAKWANNCMNNCDDVLKKDVMVLQGASSCSAIEANFAGGQSVCANCACVTPPTPVCPKVIEVDGVMQNCEFILGNANFVAAGFTSCEVIHTQFGGLPVCTGCTCPTPSPTPNPTPEPADTGYGYGYGFGRALEEQPEDEPQDMPQPNLAAKMGMKIASHYITTQ